MKYSDLLKLSSEELAQLKVEDVQEILTSRLLARGANLTKPNYQVELNSLRRDVLEDIEERDRVAAIKVRIEAIEDLRIALDEAGLNEPNIPLIKRKLLEKGREQQLERLEQAWAAWKVRSEEEKQNEKQQKDLVKGLKQKLRNKNATLEELNTIALFLANKVLED